MKSEKPQSQDARSATPPGVTAPSVDSVVCFEIADKAYAIDVAVVREVVSVDKLLPVPRSPAPIVGAFALRGATLALVDTRILFDLDASGARTTALVIARGHRTLCGLTIDVVLGVAPFAPSRFTPAGRGREPPQVAGFMPDDRGGSLVTVLDAHIIVQSLERLRF